MKLRNASILAAVLVLTSCNLYTELDLPGEAPDSGSSTDDGGAPSDADSNGDVGFDVGPIEGEAYVPVDIELGDATTRPVPWRISLPNALVDASDFGPGGSWLRAFDAEGDALPLQIESWVGNAYLVWLIVDPEDGESQRLWLSFGAEPREESPDAEDLWSAGSYDAVWGFETDPSSPLAPWAGTQDAVPVVGEGSLLLATTRVATCVEGLDGWVAAADSRFGVGATSNGRTYEVIYRADPGGTDGHILSTQDLCNGVGILWSRQRILGRLHAGTDCNAFPEVQIDGMRPNDDAMTFKHAALTVEPTDDGYDIELFIDGVSINSGSVATTNDIAGNELEIASFLGNEEHSACVDHVQIASGVRSAGDLEASVRGASSTDFTIGAPVDDPGF